MRTTTIDQGLGPRHIIKAVKRTLHITVMLTIPACTTTSPEKPFAEVRDTVRERAGYKVEWNRFAPGAEAIRTAVDELLHRELTPETAVQIALLNNRRLQSEYARIGLAQAELVQAGLLKNPIFSGTIRWAPGSQSIFDFSIVQDFLDVLLLPLEVSLAESELESVKLDVAGKVIDLAADTKRAFYDYVANEQLVSLWESTLTATESSYEMSEHLRAAGNIIELDVLNQQAALERAKLELARAQARRVTYRERLNRLMGLWGSGTQWSATHELTPLPDPQVAETSVERRALAASLELDRVYTQIEIAAKRYQVIGVMQVIPQFNLGGSMELEKEETFKLRKRRRANETKHELKEIPGSTEIWSGTEFSIGIPLFDQGQAARAAGRAVIERGYERYTALAVEIRSAAREAAYRSANAQARAKYHAQVFVPLRQTITEETQLRYNAMFDGVFQLLRAKEREIDARREFVEATKEYWLAHADLEQLLMGQLPPEYQEQMSRDQNGRAGMENRSGRTRTQGDQHEPD